jgi:hypothetical protein
MDERTKRAMLDAPAGPSAPAPLPPAPPLGPAAWAGVGGFTTGHGVPVSPPSAAALQASAALIAAAAADAAAAPPGEALLPTGANWDVLQVVRAPCRRPARAAPVQR